MTDELDYFTEDEIKEIDDIISIPTRLLEMKRDCLNNLLAIEKQQQEWRDKFKDWPEGEC